MRMWRAAIAAICVLGWTTAAPAEPTSKEGDFFVHDFRFRSGETMHEVRIHYTTLGAPIRDAKGHVTNAVLIMHGTGGDGHQFFRHAIRRRALRAPAGFWTLRATTSSFPTISATENPRSRATACTHAFPITTMTTWSRSSMRSCMTA